LIVGDDHLGEAGPSSGDQTELQITGNGLVLEGGGQLTLSDSFENMIVGTNANATLTNVDNTISGAGQIGIGDGNLTLVNQTAGTIDANFAGGTLALDTGSNIITNYGTLEASNGGELDVHSVVDNYGGIVEAVSGGHVDFFGAISGGSATIQNGTLEFDAASNVNVTFDNSLNSGTGYGVLMLHDPSNFSGEIYGFTGTAAGLSTSDAIDLSGFKSGNTSLNATYDAVHNWTILSVVDSADNLSIQLKLDGQYSTGNFKIGDATNNMTGIVKKQRWILITCMPQLHV
jgi:large repetitive protein